MIKLSWQKQETLSPELVLCGGQVIFIESKGSL